MNRPPGWDCANMRISLKGWTVAAAVLACAPGVNPVAAADIYTVATLAPGSSPYLIMTTFAQIANMSLDDIVLRVNATGTATRHALETAQGRTDFFMWSANDYDFMAQGRAMYATVPRSAELARNLRVVMAFPLGLYHMVTPAGSGVRVLSDLAGHRVYLGPAGGGAEEVMRNVVVTATGLRPGVDFTQVFLDWDSAVQAFQDGRIDVFVAPTNAPSPMIRQMALSQPIRLIGLGPAELENPALQSILHRPGGTVGKIEAGTYGDNQVNTSAVTTIGATVGIGVGTHVPEAVVYEITKAFWDGREAEGRNAPWLDVISLDKAFENLTAPLHPGALRYYREIGLDIPPALLAPDPP